jgi:hypothetical protein
VTVCRVARIFAVAMHRARTRGGLGLVAAVLLPAACSGTPAERPTQGSAASCAAVLHAEQLAQARVVAAGLMLPGPTVRLGGRDVLISPARMRVRRYLKGSGPAIVRVQTGVVGPGSMGEDGIDPAAGERWTIYTRSRRQPYATGICEGSRRTRSREVAADPPSFVYVGVGSRVELRSAATGRLVKRLANYGSSFTNNGLAVSPDRADVYVTLIGHRGLRIERIPVAGGKRRFVAAGEQPAVSPDGRWLAYVAARHPRSQRLAVRDRTSGRTRTIRLGPLVGRSADLLNGTVTWLGDASHVVAIPGPVAHAVVAGPPGVDGGACGSATCLIVVHVARRGLTAHRILLPRVPDAAMKFSGEGARPRSLLLADISGPRTTVDRIALHGLRTHVVRLLSRRDVLPIAFSPSGARLLYLVGHSPPALWVARLARGRLAHAHRLIRDARLGEAAW